LVSEQGGVVEQVVIAGAGPVGLWLAAELRLGGAGVTVLESRTERDPNSKALTVHARTLEGFASRGLHRRFLDEGVTVPSGHFAALDERLDFRALDTDFPLTLVLPQARTEEILEEHALAVGADIRRGHRLTGFEQGLDGVFIEVTGPDGAYQIEAEYLAGCDGARSTVRAAAGIAFPGTDPSVLYWLGDVVLDAPPSTPVFSRFGPEGSLMIVPMADGRHRLVGGTPEDVRTDWPGDLTLEELSVKVKLIAGTDFGMRSPSWLSRFGNASRQAERYRAGRVLLAGDAAHQHMPAGGVGMNVGIQDAMNLGWKLAATVCGWAPPGLLDSYEQERRPVGEALLLSTQAQTALMTAYSPDGLQLRRLLSELIAEQPAFSRALAERLSGLAVSYPARAGDHPLVGQRAPNVRFADTDLFTLLNSGRHVLLDFTGRPSDVDGSVAVAAGSAVRPAGWHDVSAVLVRPDGHVAWAGEDAQEGLQAISRGK
jgi:2-polyprenyl-6-methoxyphenol hydroxylase-like FAD-dependent oxidoreductase